MVKLPQDININEIFGAALIYLGYLLFLISLHLLSINTTGDTHSVINTTFIIFLAIYIGMIIFGGIGLIIRLLEWITWTVSTPDWKKREFKGGK